MKKVFLLFMTFILFGCTENLNVLITNDTQVNVSNNKLDNNYVNSLIGRYKNMYPNNVRVEYLEKNCLFSSPDDVDIIKNKEDLYIGFLNYGSPSQKLFPNLYDEVNSETHPKSKEGNGYTYYGKLIYLEDSIFLVKGSWISDLSKMEDLYKNDTDFYCMIEEERLYLIFEEIIDNISNFEIMDKDSYFTKFDESKYESDN